MPIVKTVAEIPIIKENNVDIICEMEALKELLFGYFEKINRNGVANFYSIQQSKDKFLIQSKDNQSEIIVGLCGSKKVAIVQGENDFIEKKIPNGNILTQTHSDTKKKYRTIKDLINAIKKGDVFLRYATQFSVKGNFAQDVTFEENISNMFTDKDKVITEYEKIAINIYGANSVIDWVENMTQEDFKKFFGLSPTFEELNEIKFLLSKQLNEIIISLGKNEVVDVGKNRIKEIDEEIAILEKRKEHNRTIKVDNMLDIRKLYDERTDILIQLNKLYEERTRIPFIEELVKKARAREESKHYYLINYLIEYENQGENNFQDKKLLDILEEIYSNSIEDLRI